MICKIEYFFATFFDKKLLCINFFYLGKTMNSKRKEGACVMSEKNNKNNKNNNNQKNNQNNQNRNNNNENNNNNCR